MRVGEEIPGAPPNHVPAILVVALGPGLAGVREAVARSLAAADTPSLDDADACNGDAFRISETDRATSRESITILRSQTSRSIARRPGNSRRRGSRACCRPRECRRQRSLPRRPTRALFADSCNFMEVTRYVREG